MRRKWGGVWYQSKGIVAVVYIFAMISASFKAPWSFNLNKTGFGARPIFVTV